MTNFETKKDGCISSSSVMWCMMFILALIALGTLVCFFYKTTLRLNTAGTKAVAYECFQKFDDKIDFRNCLDSGVAKKIGTYKQAKICSLKQLVDFNNDSGCTYPATVVEKVEKVKKDNEGWWNSDEVNMMNNVFPTPSNENDEVDENNRDVNQPIQDNSLGMDAITYPLQLEPNDQNNRDVDDKPMQDRDQYLEMIGEILYDSAIDFSYNNLNILNEKYRLAPLDIRDVESVKQLYEHMEADPFLKNTMFVEQ